MKRPAVANPQQTPFHHTEEVKRMAELRCPECGKELLPPASDSGKSPCICSACGREVYGWSKSKVKVSCPHCGKKNETTVTR